MDIIWFVLFSLLVIYLVIRSVRQRLDTYKLTSNFKVVDSDILHRVKEDAALFEKAYLKTFQVAKDRVEIDDLIRTKQRILKNLYVALRRLPNDIPAEEEFRKNVQKLDYAMSAKIEDVRVRYKQGYWTAPLGDYFFKQAQKGRRDITQTKPTSVVTTMLNDPLPNLREVQMLTE